MKDFEQLSSWFCYAVDPSMNEDVALACFKKFRKAGRVVVAQLDFAPEAFSPQTERSQEPIISRSLATFQRNVTRQ